MSVNAGLNTNGLVHGARGYIAINGKGLGLVENVSARVNYDMRPVSVIDDVEAVGHNALNYSVDGLSVSLLKLVGRNLISAGIQPPQAGIFQAPPMVIEIKDRPEDKALWVFEGVKFQGANFSFSKGVYTSEQVSLVALRVRYTGGLV